MEAAEGMGEGGIAELTLKDMDSAKPAYKRYYNDIVLLYTVCGKQNLHNCGHVVQYMYRLMILSPTHTYTVAGAYEPLNATCRVCPGAIEIQIQAENFPYLETVHPLEMP
jgi:hypothetical protein